jgi:hypothetical protein
MRNRLIESVSRINGIIKHTSIMEQNEINKEVNTIKLILEVIDNLTGGYYSSELDKYLYYGSMNENNDMYKKISPILLSYAKKYNPRTYKYSESMFGIYKNDKIGLYANNENEKSSDFFYFWKTIDRMGDKLKFNSFGGDKEKILKNLAVKIILDQYVYNCTNYIDSNTYKIINTNEILSLNFIYASLLNTSLFIKLGKLVEDNVSNPIEAIMGGKKVNSEKTNNDSSVSNDDSPVIKNVHINASGAALKEPGFMPALEKLSSNIGVDKNDLLKIMSKESGLNPKAVNKFSQATGLIQFMPKTANGLGTSIDELYNMSATEQLKYVEMYFKKLGVKPGMDVGDLYILTFYPAASGKPNNHVIATKGSKVYDQNYVLDVNKNGEITVQDVRNSVGVS